LIFFVGTLAAPNALQEILSLPTAPIMNHATVAGFSLQKHGENEVLVDTPSGAGSLIIDGMSITVQREEDLQALRSYFGEGYKLVNCFVKEDGPQWVRLGWTFIWLGDQTGLLEGGISSDGAHSRSVDICPSIAVF
jgi:hypothetical protein